MHMCKNHAKLQMEEEICILNLKGPTKICFYMLVVREAVLTADFVTAFQHKFKRLHEQINLWARAQGSY